MMAINQLRAAQGREPKYSEEQLEEQMQTVSYSCLTDPRDFA
jgi:hypothetical protein